MPKKPGTMLREYTEKYFVHLENLAAEVEVFDGNKKENKFSYVDYSVTINWYAGILIVEATKENKLTVTAIEARDVGTYANSFSVTGYYVIKDTLKAVWDSIEYAVYSADINMETVYTKISQAAQQSLYS